MYSKESARGLLREIIWSEGDVVPIIEASYRHRIVVHCSSRGRQKAEFANGEHPYFSSIEFVSENGQRVDRGAGTVPVLPDGRIIMVVEQRPTQGRNVNRPMSALIGGKHVDLRMFGLDSSLEFPGGAIDPGEGLKAGYLREFAEETGVKEQRALYYSRCHLVYYFGSDLAHQNSLGVIFLSGHSFERHVATDGGLNVFALAPEEVQSNIWSGAIHSGQTALQWAFYKEVETMRSNPALEKKLKKSGYVKVERIRVTQPKS